MKNRIGAAAALVGATWLLASHSAQAQTGSAATAGRAEPIQTILASGTFDVKLTPQASDSGEGATLGRMSVDKKFHGDLEATSKGEMLTAGTRVDGSAGYVAIERITGKLHGRQGTFTLQHTGTLNRGAPELRITVVPDSGTGELVGLAGAMLIRIAEGKHFYEFEYTLGTAP